MSTRWTDAELFGRSPADPIPTDPQWAGADSIELLTQVARLVRHAGWEPGNVDTTVVLEAPKLAPRKAEIQDRLGSLQDGAMVKGLLAELERKGAKLYLPRGDRDYAFHVGLRMLVLRRLVEETTAGTFAIATSERPLLAYYANAIAHLR